MVSENNIATSKMSPEEALPRMSKDPDGADIARSVYANEVRQRITLDPSKMNFTSRGTAEISWCDQQGQWQELNLPLKSISAHDSEKILDRYRVEIPAIPQTWDAKRDQYIQDETSPEYLEWLTDTQKMIIKVRYDKLLEAFDGDIMSVDGTITVWSSLNRDDCDREAALESLYALDIPSAKLQDISDIIDNLSVKTEIQSDADFKKKRRRR